MGTEIVRRHASDEVRALALTGFIELARATAGIGDVHRAVAHRAFGASGPGATPARVIHDAVTSATYGALRGGFGLAGRAADAALARSPRRGDELSSTRAGAYLIGALNGLYGDALEREGSPLEQGMTVRAGGRPVDLDADALADAFPDATRRIVVFVHGLMGTELTWELGGGPDRQTYGGRLRRDLDCTPVFVRYNTGRHISENGRSLHHLLEALVAAWPVAAAEVALIGHSMGGLVARSAAHHGALDEARWASLVRHVVSLGTPHMGAPLAQAVHYASAALHALPETRPFGGLLRRRSSGIRDLRQGSLVDEDWLDRDPDVLRGVACQEVPLLEGACHCFVSATLTRSHRHPVARLLGDTLVLHDSASGRSRSRRIPFEAEYGAHVGGASHMALLNHPAVYAKLRGWLSAGSAAPAGPAAARA